MVRNVTRNAAAWWSADEWRTALLCIASGRVRQGPASAYLEREFASILGGVCTAFALNSGRAAITLALQVFRQLVPGRSTVLVPAYVCPAVLDAVRNAGLKADFVPVGKDLNMAAAGVSQRMSDDVLAVIVAHMYGLPADVEVIESTCRAGGAFLIDDAAHAFGIQHGGRMLGTFGDAGLFSFAQGKVISTGVRGSGGMLLVSNGALMRPISQACASLRAPRHRLDGFAYFALGFQMGGIAEMVAERLDWTIERWLPRIAARRREARYRPGLIANLDASLAACQLSRFAEVRSLRQQLLDAYFKHCPAHPLLMLPQAANGRFLSRLICRLPERCSGDRIRDRLRGTGIECRLPYPVPEGNHPALRSAAELTKQLLELPLHPKMSGNDAGWVLDQVDRLCHTEPVDNWTQVR